MNKPVIHIWDTVGLGVIITFPTGIMISNQTGGTACLHPKCEGVYVPLANDYNEETKEFLSADIELSAYFSGNKYNGSGAVNGVDQEDVAYINAILNTYGLNQFITINLAKLKESHEAWIHIKINKDTNFQIIKGFDTYPLSGILTWSNSD